ncbi:MAG: RNA polymerase sigma factor [Gammaproteobacteria bacterium]|nr:RNA polymerase sigma factor [Gammaproteobacteria bacterium]
MQRAPVAQPVLEQLQIHHADNFGWALACCAWHRDSAEDVLQEAYLRVVDGRARFGGKSSLKTWFFSVIKRVAAQNHRTAKRHALLNMRALVPGHSDLVASQVSEPDALSSAVEETQSCAEMRTALMQLSARQREVLHLVFYSELTLEEAATTLQISIGSARTHYHRGKERLGELLNGEANHEPA